MRVVTMVCYGKQPSNAESGPSLSGWLSLLVSDGRGGLVVRSRSGPCCRRIPGSKPNFTDDPPSILFLESCEVWKVPARVSSSFNSG
ncbi:hypothetical protein AVEN_94669-1 [Araneus ventricosus]|uniref:Uncharacterized protein n=1 Tax=Araneus ventricosus TaxID=182803 RepID=A0A4Y2Q9Y6_ARAVE|nr:hypothetical protein AVEN_94669-1 [Araneus ventricosus]